MPQASEEVLKVARQFLSARLLHINNGSLHVALGLEESSKTLGINQRGWPTLGLLAFWRTIAPYSRRFRHNTL